MVGSFGLMFVRKYLGLKRKCAYCGKKILYTGEFGDIPLGQFCTRCGKPLFEEKPEIERLASIDTAMTSQNVAEKQKLWRRGNILSRLGWLLALICLPMPIILMFSNVLSELKESQLVGIFLSCWIVGLVPLFAGMDYCQRACGCPACGKCFSPSGGFPKSRIPPDGGHCPQCGADLKDYISKVFGI
jgi:hypothetical protein